METRNTRLIELDHEQLEIIFTALNYYWLNLADKSETFNKIRSGELSPEELYGYYNNPDVYEQTMRKINTIDLIILKAKHSLE